MRRVTRVGVVALALLGTATSHAQWRGFEDRSAERGVERYDFGTAGGSNENYYDGDMGDYDGDGRIDRALVSRFGLLHNAGEGRMIPVSTQRNGSVAPNSGPSLTGYLFGDEVRIGNDAVQFVDLDADGDLDVIQGGNGEPLVVQTNLGGRFAVTQRLTGSAVQIVTTDLERDGDADLVVACWFPSGPDDFRLFANDGTGTLTEVTAGSGAELRGEQVIGVASGDVDRDGDFDLIVLSRLRGALRVLRNDGRGRFSGVDVPIPGRFRVTSGFSQGTQLGDIDGDGDLDVVIVTDDYVGSHDRVGHLIFVNDGAGGFTEQSGSRFRVEGGFAGRLVGGNGKLVDVDYDGDLDLVAFTDLAGPPLNFQLFLNDGTGVFEYTTGQAPAFGGARPDSVGADIDVADLDGDGTYDLWVGIGGGRVTHLHNTYRRDDGRPADEVRDVRAERVGDAVEVSWRPPAFASTARHYEILRSPSAGRAPADRPVVARVGPSEFEDEGFVAPLTLDSRAVEIADPDVRIEADRIVWTDRDASGAPASYSVVHVGPENARGAPSPEVLVDAADEDGEGPSLAILAPQRENWMSAPRVAVAFADASGVASVQVTLDRDVPGSPAGSNLLDRADVRTTDFAQWTPREAWPVGAYELTLSAEDVAGNRAEVRRRFGVTTAPRGGAPTVSLEASPSSGTAPLDVGFSATVAASGGEVVRVEWSFGDGATGLGREVRHRFASAGTYEVEARAIDDTGATAWARATVEVAPCEGECDPPDAGSGADAGGSPDAGPRADAGEGGEDAGEDRVPGRPSGGCAAAPGGAAAWLVAGWLLLVRRRARRW